MFSLLPFSPYHNITHHNISSKKVVSREAFLFWRLALKYYRQKS